MSNQNAKRFNAGSGGGFGSSVQVRSLENPFDTANGQPKWPDGLAHQSIGRRHQATSEVTLDDYTVVLFPGTINWCLVLKPTGDIPTGHTQIWANHSTNISFAYAFLNTTVEGGDQASVSWEVGLDGFVKWRPVAYAMHTQLLNTSDRNEGWYEAVRVDKNSFLKKWCVFGGVGSELGNGNYIKGTPHFHMGGSCPDHALASLMHSSRLWNREPTYVTGELQDLHNAIFQLNTVKENNVFKKLSAFAFEGPFWKLNDVYQRDDLLPNDQVGLFKPHDNFLDAEAAPTPRLRDIPDNWVMEQILADSFDVIVLRVHGVEGTKLLLHSVANFEFLCAENGQMSQYATECDNNKRQLENYLWTRNSRFKYPFHYITSGGHLRVPRPPYY